MASHRGAVGLIAPKAKPASVGGIPALAVAAVLLLGGCGGGGEESSSTSAAREGSSAGIPAKEKGDISSSGSGQSAKTAQGPDASSGESQDGGAPGAKHGSGITVPKGTPEHAPTAAEKEELTIADITLTSPAVPASGPAAGTLPAAYTCDGENSWPELRWRGVPKGTKELALFAMSVAPVEGKLFFDWAVAGLEPSLEKIEAGRLPKGAVVGTNSLGKRGYEICPEGPETYVFALFALPEPLSPRPGFDARTLRDEALEVSGNVGLLAVGYGG